MNKKLLFAAILIMAFAFPAFAATCYTEPSAASPSSKVPDPYSLEIINEYDLKIKGIYLLQTGTDKWSENILGNDPLEKGKRRYLDIGRKSILGLCNLKIVDGSGKEKIWERLPILEIFSIKFNRMGDIEYERIKLSS